MKKKMYALIDKRGVVLGCREDKDMLLSWIGKENKIISGIFTDEMNTIEKDDFELMMQICLSNLDVIGNKETFNGKKYIGYFTHSFLSHQEKSIYLLQKYGYLKKVLKNKEVYERIK